MKHRIIALTAALLMAAGTGCSDTKDGNGEAKEQKLSSAEVSKGRYVEEKVSSDGIKRVTEFSNSPDHAFVDSVYNSQGAVHRLNENGFKAESLPEGINTDTVYDAAVSPNGDIFCSLFGEDGSEEYWLFPKDGSKKKLDIGDADMLLSFEFSAEGRLFALSSEGGLYEIDTEKAVMSRLCAFSGIVQTIDIVGDRIFCGSPDDLFTYDISKGSEAETDSALAKLWKDCVSEYGFGNIDIFAGSGSDIYLLCQGGIYRFTLGGSITEQIVDGIYTDIGSSDDPAICGALDKDGSFIVGFNDGSVKRYRYDPEAVNEFISELNVYALKANKTLSQAMRIFARKHPEIKLNMNIGMKDGMTYEDAAKNLTAEILSGNAPDLIMLDGLDTESFEAKGMLLDLSEISDKWKPDEELFDNIAEWNSEGGLRSVACKFGVPVLIGRTDKIDSISSYSDVAGLIEERYRSGEATQEDEEFIPESFVPEAIGRVVTLYGNRMVKDGKPDEAVIKELLESAKRINDLPEYGFESRAEDYSDKSSSESAMSAAADLLSYSEDLITSTQTLYNMTSIHDNNQKSDIRYGFKDNPNTFMPICELGICSSSKNADAAAELIKTALSSDVQSAMTEDGLPVNKKGLDDLMAGDEGMNYGGIIYDASGCVRNYSISNPDDDEQAELKSFIEKADTAVRLDAQTRNDMIEAGSAYLCGDITLDEAVKRITDKLELRMKE